MVAILMVKAVMVLILVANMAKVMVNKEVMAPNLMEITNKATTKAIQANNTLTTIKEVPHINKVALMDNLVVLNLITNPLKAEIKLVLQIQAKLRVVNNNLNQVEVTVTAVIVLNTLIIVLVKINKVDNLAIINMVNRVDSILIQLHPSCYHLKNLRKKCK